MVVGSALSDASANIVRALALYDPLLVPLSSQSLRSLILRHREPLSVAGLRFPLVQIYLNFLDVL